MVSRTRAGFGRVPRRLRLPAPAMLSAAASEIVFLIPSRHRVRGKASSLKRTEPLRQTLAVWLQPRTAKGGAFRLPTRPAQLLGSQHSADGRPSVVVSSSLPRTWARKTARHGRTLNSFKDVSTPVETVSRLSLTSRSLPIHIPQMRRWIWAPARTPESKNGGERM